MKRISILALILLVACSKGGYADYDVLGGRSTNTATSSMGRNYMMAVADELIAGVLDEMTLAQTTQDMGSTYSSHFTIMGGFNTLGSTWMVTAPDSAFEGLSIRCTGENSWNVNYEGDFYMGGYTYPTTFKMRILHQKNLSPQVYDGWLVSLEGERTERGGYRCTFDAYSNPLSSQMMSFYNTLGANISGWNGINGDLFMTVSKDGVTVDVCRLSFKGAPSAATYTRGL